MVLEAESSSRSLEEAGELKEKAKDLRERAERARHQLLSAGQGREVLLSEEDEDSAIREAASYNILVPLFFR